MDRLFLTVLPSSPALHDHTFPCTCASVQSPKQGKVGRENDATQGSQEVKSTIDHRIYFSTVCIDVTIVGSSTASCILGDAQAECTWH